MTRRLEADQEFAAFVLDANAGLVRFGTLLVGQREGGEDVTQAALLKVYGSWPRIQDKAAAAAYTRAVMVRLAERGRRRRWSGERPTEIRPDAVVTLDRSDELAVADVVHRSLARLPLGQRAVLVLRYFEMRSESEVADILGISLGTVKSRSARGLEALRDQGLLRSELLSGGELR